VAREQAYQNTEKYEMWCRTKQARFRADVMKKWDGKCCVTSVNIPNILVAAHIKPWSASSPAERIDPENSLLLTPIYDRLFDKFVITFGLGEENGIAHIDYLSEIKKYANSIGLNLKAKINKISISGRRYLKYPNKQFDVVNKRKR
jgi:predicted restriction endonuclease